MPIDTANERRAVFALPWSLPPVPDGAALTEADRRQVAGLYRITEAGSESSGYYTEVTELPPLTWPGVRGGYIFRWQDNYTDKLYQLYVNGVLAGETTSTLSPKQIMATAPQQFTWQVIAIDEDCAGTDYSAILDDGDEQGNRVRIRWLRDASRLELGSVVNIYSDSHTGTVDYSDAVNLEPIENFPAGALLYGFGMAGFGELAFGFDGEGIGFGLGTFGQGDFGFDADYVQWISPVLPPEVYKFDPRVKDAAGNEETTGNVQTHLLDGYPAAPASVKIDDYDGDTNTVTLTVTCAEIALPW